MFSDSFLCSAYVWPVCLPLNPFIYSQSVGFTMTPLSNYIELIIIIIARQWFSLFVGYQCFLYLYKSFWFPLCSLQCRSGLLDQVLGKSLQQGQRYYANTPLSCTTKSVLCLLLEITINRDCPWSEQSKPSGPWHNLYPRLISWCAYSTLKMENSSRVQSHVVTMSILMSSNSSSHDWKTQTGFRLTAPRVLDLKVPGKVH